MKLCAFVPFNIPYCSFLPHNSLSPSTTLFYCFQNCRRYFFFFHMCYTKFCKSVPVLRYDRSNRSHILKTCRNPSQDTDETPKPAKQSKLFSLKRERTQKITCSSHWNNPIPKKCQTFFSPNLNTDSSTPTPTALLNRWGEKKEKEKHHTIKKKVKRIPCSCSEFQKHQHNCQNYINCAFPHRTEIRKFCPRVVHGGKKQKMYVNFTHKRLKGKKQKPTSCTFKAKRKGIRPLLPSLELQDKAALHTCFESLSTNEEVLAGVSQFPQQ